MYVRVKRARTTVFLQTEPTDLVAALKAKLGAILSKDPSSLRLLRGQRPLLENATIADNHVEPEEVLAMTYLLDDGSWEPVDIEEPDLLTGAT